MAEPSFLSGSMLYLWSFFVVLISSLDQWVNFETVSRILDCGARHQTPWFPNLGKAFLYTHLISKTGLISDLFGRQMLNMYIVRSV